MRDRVGKQSVLESSMASWQTAGLLMAAGILVVGTTLDPLPLLSVEGQRTLAVFLSVLVLWLTRPMRTSS